MFQRIAPLFFTVLGGLITGALILRALNLSAGWIDTLPMIGFALVYAFWMYLESRVTRGELNRTHTDLDNFTMELAAVVKTCLLVTLFIDPLSRPLLQTGVGFLVALAGISLRVWAIMSIGIHYSHRIRVPEQVLDVGPYGKLRHPAYLGTGLAHTGFVIVFLNWFSLVMLGLWWGVVWLRAIMEERALAEYEPYRNYSKKVTTRLIPFLW